MHIRFKLVSELKTGGDPPWTVDGFGNVTIYICVDKVKPEFLYGQQLRWMLTFYISQWLPFPVAEGLCRRLMDLMDHSRETVRLSNSFPKVPKGTCDKCGHDKFRQTTDNPPQLFCQNCDHYQCDLYFKED